MDRGAGDSVKLRALIAHNILVTGLATLASRFRISRCRLYLDIH